MFKYKSLLIVTFAFTVSLTAVLFDTNEVAAQPGNKQIILASRKSKPRTILRTRTTPGLRSQCSHNFWGCLNLNPGANALLRLFSPATAFPRKPKPECKDNAWVCPILSPQGDTSSSEDQPNQEPKPECKDNAWACPILSPQGNTSPSQSSFK